MMGSLYALRDKRGGCEGQASEAASTRTEIRESATGDAGNDSSHRDASHAYGNVASMSGPEAGEEFYVESSGESEGL